MSDPFAAFDRILRSGRLGEPVYLRCQVTGPPERALQRLAETMVAATTVMGGAPDRVQARGDTASGSLHAVLLFRSGACVLVTTGPGDETVDGMLLGNHGAAYGPGVPLSRYQHDTEPSSPRDPEVVECFLRSICQALSTREAAVVEAWGDD
jgi:hypothetical protein